MKKAQVKHVIIKGTRVPVYAAANSEKNQEPLFDVSRVLSGTLFGIACIGCYLAYSCLG